MPNLQDTSDKCKPYQGSLKKDSNRCHEEPDSLHAVESLFRLMTSLMGEASERYKITGFEQIGYLFSKRAQFGFTGLENDVNLSIQLYCTEEMPDI